MKRTLMSLAVCFLLFAVPLLADNTPSTTRIARQHHLTQFQEEKMGQSEASILNGLKSSSIGLQRSSLQALRELEQVDTKYPFNSMIAPLSAKLEDQLADPVVRVLAALALDQLHSDAGDAAIKAEADRNDDMSLKSLCQALLIRSELQ